ncbi:MAG: RNA polymerase factor sigma-32 [Myxococcota bacterium]|nr:RNA polymerase factor sigma-32 [Myxococcota bacterium]
MSTHAITVVGELDRYIAQISRYPILDHEEETRLAVRWREKGDVQAAHTLVTSNLRFVVKIANEYRGYGARLLDLIQEGSLGLMRAVKKFDPHRGYRLLSYAVHWIRAEIHSFLMRTVKSVKLGTARAHRKLFFKLRALKGKLAAQGVEDRDTVIDLIAEETGVDKQEVEEMDLRLCSRELSLDAPVGEPGTALAEFVPAEVPTPENAVVEFEVQADRAARLDAALMNLQPREREIIEQRYLTEKPRQLKEIGNDMGISKQRVAQIEQRAIEKLRNALRQAA